MEEEAAPDFYALSREHPLPESHQAARPKSKPEALPSPAVRPPSPVVSVSLSSQAPAAAPQSADAELAMLELRRANILERMNSLAATRGLPAGPGLVGFRIPDVSPFGSLPPLMGVSPLLSPAAELDLLRQRRENLLATSDMNKLYGAHDIGFGGLAGLPPSAMLNRRYMGL
jgi:hypothetical protein